MKKQRKEGSQAKQTNKTKQNQTKNNKNAMTKKDAKKCLYHENFANITLKSDLQFSQKGGYY